LTTSDAATDTPPVEQDPAAPRADAAAGWRVGDDVTHRDLGHGWVQGAGHGVVTVRFETRSSGPGPARTFPAGPSDTGDIEPANPVDSLDWPDYVAALTDNASAQPVDDVAQR
jgi:DNA polymerase IV